jgi:hypothetical protein
MKKTWRSVLAMLAVLAYAAFLSGCGKSVSADSQGVALTMGLGFDVSQAQSEEKVTLTTSPYSKGVAGDGFVIQYQGANYFLSEDMTIALPTDRRYKLWITRVFGTDRGLIADAQGQWLDLNTDKPEISKDVLNLQVVDAVHFLVEPRIIASFKSGNIAVGVYRYMGPPTIVDDVQMTFAAFVRTSMPSIDVYGAPQDGRVSFKLPSDTAYTEAHARSRIYDSLNNRFIVSLSSFMEFER